MAIGEEKVKAFNRVVLMEVLKKLIVIDVIQQSFFIRCT